MNDRLLDGISVLDLTAMGPGPRCARILADHGARVVQVVPSRLRPQIELPDWLYSWSREVDRIGVDLKDGRGVELVASIAVRVDAVVESFRPGVAARLGLGYEALRRRRDDVVYASVSGYGQSGPYASWAAHDLNWLGVCGYLSLTGRDADGLPALPGSPIADGAGGWAAATAVIAALLRRARTGQGAHLDVAVVEAVLRQTYVHVDQFLATGTGPAQGDDQLLGGRAFYAVYRCGDGRDVTVAAVEPKFFANLCRLLELEELAGAQHDPDRQPEIRAAFARRFATRSRDEWVALLGPADTCVAPVNSIDEVSTDRHLIARDAVWTVARADGGSVAQVAPILVGGSRPPADEVTVHNRARTSTAGLLHELGLADDTTAGLADEGVLR